MTETVCFKNIGQLIQTDVSADGQPHLKFSDHSALLVENGRIESVVPSSGLKSSDYSKMIDLKGKPSSPVLSTAIPT